MKIREWRNWSDYFAQLRQALLEPTVDEEALARTLREARARQPVPVVWMLGKTQAGKTSIIRALTGSEAAEIGNGFQPCTRSARFYDYPAEAPVVRFLDTRGLGEVDYDPDEDIRFCEACAHLLLVVMKVADPGQQAIADVVREIRRRHPDWPVLVAQTGLHEHYPSGHDHVVPWPFDEQPLPDSVPVDLRRALTDQRERFGLLPGDGPVHWVAIDLTLPEDGFEPQDYGLDALWDQMEILSALQLRQLLGTERELRDVFARAAHPHIVGHALAAAGMGALPVVDLVAVTTVQAKMLHSLASLHRQRWDARMITEFLGLVGAGVATSYVGRWVGRTLSRLVPVLGQTVVAVWGASASGASTYALGKAAVYFLSRRRYGLEIDAATVRRIYAGALKDGERMLRERFRRERGEADKAAEPDK